MKEIVFSGFGGQGVLTGGLVWAYAVMEKGNHVTWMPSYGPEMRGGKSKCVVKYGETPEEPVTVPMMACIDVLVAMNHLALEYLSYCREGALVLINEDVVARDSVSLPDHIVPVWVPCASLAYQAENQKGASIVALGALCAATGQMEPGFVKDAMHHMFEDKGKGAMRQINDRAFDLGYQAVKKEQTV